MAAAVSCAPAPAPAEPLLVAAASDLQFAFGEIAALYTQQTGVRVTLTFGSTGQLTQQIENGAPYDVFAAADDSYIRRLKAAALLLPGTDQPYAAGRLVLAVNRQAGISPGDLKALTDPAIRQIAIANPEHAPYGVAARQALQSAGVWERVKAKVVYGENVRQALQYVQTGDAPVGIVALSVANVPEVSFILLDAQLHAPLNQTIAVIGRSPRPETARAFVAFINGPQGRPVMHKYGFSLPGEL